MIREHHPHGELIQVRALVEQPMPVALWWGGREKQLEGAVYNPRLNLVYLQFEGGMEISAPPAGYVCVICSVAQA